MNALLNRGFFDRARRRTAYACCVLIIGLGLIASGCGRTASSPAGAPQNGTGFANSSYRLNREPIGATDLNMVHAEARDGDDVVIVGRIGGRATPWIDGLAAFTIVDQSATPPASCCPASGPHCGDTDVPPASQALVRIVDGEGRTVATDVRRLLGIDRPQVVVVRGRAQRDEAGNLTILADGVFVRPEF